MYKLSRFLLLTVIACCCGLLTAQTSYHDKPSYLQHKAGNNTRLMGSVKTPVDSKITFKFYKNNISFAEEIIVVPLLADNTFSLSFTLVEATTALLSYNGEETSIYIEPGDRLSMEFVGKDFLNTLEYEGKGSVHNEYLLKFYEEFKTLDKNFIGYETSMRSPEEFITFIDSWKEKKWRFHKKYDKDKKEQFSKEFTNYAFADIDYWSAYNLINYRIERPRLTGQPIPMDLPMDYYRFLNEIVISNDNALNNRYYVEFLEEYIKLRQEKHTVGEILETDDVYYIVEASAAVIMKSPDNPPIIDQPVEGTLLKYLDEKSDFMSKGIIKEKMYEDYWYKVETQDGLKGWVLGVGIKPTDAIDDSKKEQNHIGRIERYALTKESNIEVRASAHDEENIVSVLSYGVELENLRNKTTEQFKYEKSGIVYMEYFHKIKTPDGKIGWVASRVIDLKERKISNSGDSGYFNSITNTRNAEKYLKGKSLQYLLAKGLYWKTHLNDLDAVGREIAEFESTNEFEVYNKILKGAYEVAQLRGKGDKFLVNSYSYSHISSAFIEGIGVPKNVYTASNKANQGTAVASNSKHSDYVEIDCKGVKRATTSTSIKGRFGMEPDQVAELIIYTEPTLFQEKRFDLSSNFDIKIDLANPVVGEIRYGDEVVKLYLEPGDKIKINAQGTKLIDNLKIEGKGAIHNNYILAAQKAFEPINTELKEQIVAVDSDEFKDFMKRSLKKKQQFISKYDTKSSFTNDFIQYAEAEIDYWYAYQLLNYTVEHPLLQTNSEEGRMKVSKKYYNFLNDIPLARAGALNSFNYSYFLNEYFSYMLEKKEHKGLTSKELGEQFLTEEAYYFYKTKELAIACKRGQTKEVGSEIASFIKNCPYERYNNALRFVYNESKELLVGSTAPDFELKDIEGNTVSLSDLKGKVIYMDFWATWCTPCIRSLLNSKRIKERFKGQDVVFMYVSLDDSAEIWDQYVKQNNLEGLHIYGEGSVNTAEVAQLYKVAHLPTFILIDKDGKIAFNPAKNPGNSQLIDQINGLLGNPKF